ncbi:MAG: Bug family tripartite tricarboxylate transporter substrate binding protein [Rhizomicrobium sp.]
MTSDRRRFLQVAGASVTLPSILQMAWPLLTASDAVAQTKYPNKPIQMLVGFAAGGPADIVARLVGDELSKGLGRPVVIDNVAGAGGNTATDRAAKAAPDGYTLLMATPGPIVVNPILYQKLPFDPIRDLVPISELCFQPNILVTNIDVPARNVGELVQIARAEPGKLTFASGGVGTTQHLAGELFKSMAQIHIRHIPYRSIAAALPDILEGRITMAFAAPSVVLHLVRESKLRALAMASLKRSPSAPDLPTMSESGFPGFDATAWFGLMAPAGTPEPIIDRLLRETVRVLALPDLRKKFDELGIETIGNSPAEFEAVIRAETLRWAKVIKDSGTSLKD